MYVREFEKYECETQKDVFYIFACFQVVSEPNDEAGITDKEHWEKVVRSVCLRLNFFSDFLKGYFNIGNKITAITRSQADLDREYSEELEYYRLFETLFQRDKELFEMKCILYELKCTVLSIIGEPHPVPPKYTPFPDINFKPPVRKLAISPVKPALDSQMKNNAVFRSIMEKKCSNELEELESGEEENLSRSWEQVYILDN